MGLMSYRLLTNLVKFRDSIISNTKLGINLKTVHELKWFVTVLIIFFVALLNEKKGGESVLFAPSGSHVITEGIRHIFVCRYLFHCAIADCC